MNKVKAAWRLIEKAKQMAVLSDKWCETYQQSRDFIAGIFNSVIQRELVPVVGRKTEAIPALLKAWEADTSYAGQGRITRGSVVNAFTRYAHETVQDDFVSAQIERAVPELLYGRGDNKPAPLSYLPVGA